MADEKRCCLCEEFIGDELKAQINALLKEFKDKFVAEHKETPVAVPV